MEEIKINTLKFTADEWDGSWEGKYYTDYPAELECNVSEGYRFVGWEVNGQIVSEEVNLTLPLQEKDMVIEAVLEKL